MSMTVERRFPAGAEPCIDGVHFRVWAPARQRVDVAIDTEIVPLKKEADGYFSGVAEGAQPGMRYGFLINGRERIFPDPASRFQPEGPHGLSQIVDPQSYDWKDQGWKGVRINEQVIYEMHIGTFTPAGTWNAAQDLLPELERTGITLLEIMPVAEFPGRFGWGYDGVAMFAPTHLYGTPDDFRAFVDRAHALRIGVILDVVYNHLGPDGNYLREYSPTYFTQRYKNEWGDAINFDGPGSEAVREFFVSNACYWIEEFHLDGLRFDATQQIFDSSPEHILAEICRDARRAAGQRSLVFVAENEPQDTRIVRTGESGYGLDGMWNDDFHHSVKVALTGRNEAYYSDYSGRPQELISAVKWGFLYQGQHYCWQGKGRGTYALDLPSASFVNYIQNHDQIANSAYGWRPQELSDIGTYKAMTALLLLSPGTPMLFQGQEYGASTPFLYFADHKDDIAQSVRKGREKFLNQFRSLAHSRRERPIIFPDDPASFERSKLNPDERKEKVHMVALHRDLLSLRRTDPVFRAQRADWIHAAVLGSAAFLLRFVSAHHGDRLLIVNLGRDLHIQPSPEPLLAPPKSGQWELLWSSESPLYRGSGQGPFVVDGTWKVPGRSALVMHERRDGN